MGPGSLLPTLCPGHVGSQTGHADSLLSTPLYGITGGLPGPSPDSLEGKAETANLSDPHSGFLGQAPVKNSAGVGVSQQHYFDWERATLPAC